jgi:molybdate transport system regulatory protein
MMKEAGRDPSSREATSVGVHVAHRIWLEDQGTPVFGIGICELLTRVEATGSIRRAASDMGMAYSKAWQIVRRAEEHLGLELMVRHAGGKGGGCSVVSVEGRWLLGAFGALTDDAAALVAELFDRHLGQLNRPAPKPSAVDAAERIPVNGG